MKICIFTVANRPYVDLAYALYKSVRQFHTKIVYFECFLVNPKKRNKFSTIKNDNKLIVNKVKYNGGDEKLFSCHLRISLYKKLLEKDYNLVYWCDADTLIRKNLWNYFKSLYQYDIILWRAGKSKYKSSMIGINNNINGKNFINSWDKIYNFQKKKTWQSDQKTLKKTIERSNVKINLLKGSRNKFFDLEFRNNTYIWIGKGNRKNSKKYRHYMNLLLKK